jgi:hypothetical protein
LEDHGANEALGHTADAKTISRAHARVCRNVRVAAGERPSTVAVEDQRDDPRGAGGNEAIEFVLELCPIKRPRTAGRRRSRSRERRQTSHDSERDQRARQLGHKSSIPPTER